MKVNFRLRKIGNWLVSPFSLGLGLTLIFCWAAKTFYEVRNRNEAGLLKNDLTTMVYRAVEGLDFILADARFLIRGEKNQTQSQVALVAFDDESLAVVGRWPWSRELKAKLIDQLFQNGVKAVGMDVIWSEPQESSSKQTLDRLTTELKTASAQVQMALKQEKNRPQPDDVLFDTLKKHREKIVLGVFPTDETDPVFSPFSDYCRNEAFGAINGSLFVKADNISLAVLDNADRFEAVNFKSRFDKIFPVLKQQTQAAFLTQNKIENAATLSTFERNRMQISIESELVKYCDRWLLSSKDSEDSDPFLELWTEFFSSLATSVPAFKGMNGTQAIAEFKRLTLSHPVPQHNNWTVNLPRFHEATLYSGSFKAVQDDDGKIRRNPLFYRTGNRIGSSFIPSLALQTYLVANPGYQAQVEIDVDPRNREQKVIQSFRIIDINKDEKDQEIQRVPVDGQGRLKINFAGPQQTYAHIPAKELLNDSPEMIISQRGRGDTEFHRERVKKSEFLKDRIVMLGATAVGIYDLRVTPFEKNFPGPETHLTVLDNLLTQNFIRVAQNEERSMIFVLFVLGFLISLGVAFTGPVTGFIFVILAESLLIWGDQQMLRSGMVSTMILPALLVLSLYTVMILYKYFTEERKKKQLKLTFAKYVSPAIVDEILKHPDNLNLGGRKQELTVFFSDLRDFTTISEKLEPTKLAELLNRYLTAMTEIVFANKGTLDKYMGDAIMAFFGAPVDLADHPAHACRCALASMQKLKQLQLQFASEGLPYLDLGIGINTAEVSVGNMGSAIVQSYTVMGDGVNLASRLESINKEYGTHIVISQFTHARVQHQFTTREIDRVRVKGKQQPVRIFELICEGPASGALGQSLEIYNRAFQLFHEQKFAPALSQFETGLLLTPEDLVFKLYIERCQFFLKTPPEPHWDGVVTMKIK